MDDSEAEQLQDIADEVQGSHVRLGKIDERTRNIERQLENISENVDENAEDVSKLKGKVKRNTTIVSAFTGGMTLVIAWLLDKIGASV